jgi:cobalt/nickel transport protein
MMRFGNAVRWVLPAAAVAGVVTMAFAHFQVILPATDLVDKPGAVALEILFTHPMEQGPVMNMGTPRQFGVLHKGRKRDLLKTLKKKSYDSKTGYTTTFQIREPGDHVFYLEPAPYWEPAEGKMIVHYTKVVVNAMGEEAGWDATVGLPVEIEPLVRPYGLWTGNLFRGMVKKDGRPVPFAEIEVEYWNQDRKVAIPGDAFVTQVIKADGNGVFSYAMPRAGWWGFAALVEADEKMKNPDGAEVPVELGALIWVRCVDMKAGR